MADLIYEVHNHLARITLNRPKQLNCFSEEMIRLWTEALEDVRDNDDVYALLLSGNGKAFCAGGDVKAMMLFSYIAGNSMRVSIYSNLSFISRVAWNLTCGQCFIVVSRL